jgi:hypothetical protein
MGGVYGGPGGPGGPGRRPGGPDGRHRPSHIPATLMPWESSAGSAAGEGHGQFETVAPSRDSGLWGPVRAPFART